MTGRKALIVGIDHYEHAPKLRCCIDDAKEVLRLLQHNGDASKSRNFQCKCVFGSDERHAPTRGQLKDDIVMLFDDDVDVALFYFSGHGYIDSIGGYIITSECSRGDDGVSLRELVDIANESKARSKIIILDSCFSGDAGRQSGTESHASIAEGVTILTASRNCEVALETRGHGVFTGLLIDALRGSAANIVGEITPGSVYAHIDQSLSRWEQRPVFKTNTKEFISLRNIEPLIPLNDLRKLSSLFPSADYIFPLDPSYEMRDEARGSDMPPANPDHNRIFSVLQAYNRQGLVVPDGTEHMWSAAMESKGCKLTLLGRHYRMLVDKGLV